MKKPFEDRITERIREVMEHYEPEYSPQAWDKLRKQIPVPEFWLKRLFLKYKYWISDIAMIGVLVLVYNAASDMPEDKNSAVNTLFSETADYFDSEKPRETVKLEASAALVDPVSNTGVSQYEKNISSKVSQFGLSDSLPAAYNDNTQTGRAIKVMAYNIEKEPVKPVILAGKGFCSQYNITELIPVKPHTEEIPVSKSPSYGKAGKSKFHWPEFNTLFKKEEGYDKFTGPNKLALFYSPEMLHTDSLGTLGLSHGVGLSFEGSIRSSISISAGISYQSINFRKTVYSEKLPPYDNADLTEYYDSIGIRSGSYKYLEVPVSLNFKFFESSGSQVWLGAGISSMVFLKQDYTSENFVGVSSDQVNSSAKGWENFLPLASLNLSLLYRYKISDRFLLHSSAQYKYQPGRLGYNAMKLNRINLQIGLIYSFGRKR